MENKQTKKGRKMMKFRKIKNANNSKSKKKMSQDEKIRKTFKICRKNGEERIKKATIGRNLINRAMK